MNAAQALNAARVAGISLALMARRPRWKPKPAPTALLDLMSRYKVGIVALLRPSNAGWSGEDWLAFYEARASTGLLLRYRGAASG